MYVCSCLEDYEIADVFNMVHKKARKEYKCCECGELIKPGDIYENVKMLYDSLWSTHHTCSVCSKIASSLQACGRVPTRLWEDIHNSNCMDYTKEEDYFCICP